MVEIYVIKNQKRGIAMVELIFALVIMGIVLLSAPMLIQQSIRSGNVALQQEAIAAASSQTAIILSMHWDENNNSNLVGSSPILHVDRTPFDFNLTNAPAGLLNIVGRNFEKGGELRPATAFADFGMDFTDDNDTNETSFLDFDDVDDYNNSNFGLIIFNSEETTSDVGDYVDVNITMSTQVNYTEDRPRGGVLNSSNIIINPIGVVSRISANSPVDNPITNIKFIRVNLTSDSEVKELEKNITLEAFSCNIGTTLPEGKETP
jgi:type II secretory pathway pseudopilin PulG